MPASETDAKARLKRALNLLRDPGSTARITDIAASVGYGDLSTFNRAFRRYFGDKPSALRTRG